MENDLIEINDNNTAVTTSIAIAQGVERQHKNVIALIREKSVYIQNHGPLAFQTRVVREGQSGGQSAEIAILNEDQATLLITFMRSSEIVDSFKSALIGKFRQMKDELNKNVAPALPDFSDPVAAARAWADQQEQYQIAEQKRIEAEGTLDMAKPMIDFYEQVAFSGDTLSMKTVASLLGVGRTNMMAALRDIGWLCKGNEKNMPTRKMEKKGFLVSKISRIQKIGPDKVVVTPRFTPKGAQVFQEMLIDADSESGRLPF